MANEGNSTSDDLQLLVQHGDDVVAAVQAAVDLARSVYGLKSPPADWVAVGWDVHDLPRHHPAERSEQVFRDRLAELGRRHAAVLRVFERVEDAIVLANPEGLRPMFSMHWNDSSAVHVMVRLAGDLLAHHERGEFAALLDNDELAAGLGRPDGLEQLQHRVRLDVAKLRRMQPAPSTSGESPGRWMSKTEAAKQAGLKLEGIRRWFTRSKNPLPTRWNGGREEVNLDDVERERDQKARRPKRTEAHADSARMRTATHGVKKPARSWEGKR